MTDELTRKRQNLERWIYWCWRVVIMSFVLSGLMILDVFDLVLRSLRGDRPPASWSRAELALLGCSLIMALVTFVVVTITSRARRLYLAESNRYIAAQTRLCELISRDQRRRERERGRDGPPVA